MTSTDICNRSLTGRISLFIKAFGIASIRYPLFRKITSSSLTLKKWNGLRDLVERPWFTRLWVLQEVGLSRRAIAFCGNYSVEFGEIVLFSLYCSHMSKFL